ncbi:biliverdin-producing heme oxygenase [Rubinisphaera brasiliensis]|uniref:Heme oxygenase n=1 Tax=Rubinisphaera brasiliensis (strain ATCC 49424 / DSM 5305 / JCM 21570 / IAM 15109 / NBRC 103401 / IFAM 1448) TaxID=756272 RepID=F0SP76_RUBBR|nr:biliverdin-producing heme oxygenase [Rubinisphaera brasiliensis]ADY61179.1 heme oxygenase [Rubinisphaera brasiliensis DSM 5305]
MSVMDVLRQATRPQHEKLHEVVSLDEMTQDRDSYAEMLRRYLAAVQPSEAEANSYLAELPSEIGLDWNERLQKSDWLAADLSELGGSVSVDIAPCYGELASPAPDGPEKLGDPELLGRFLGTVYVMEGMTLGADRMVGVIAERLSVSSDSGARFFSGYGRENATMWKQFRVWGAEQDVDVDLAAETAREIFGRFERCLSGQSRTGECA